MSAHSGRAAAGQQPPSPQRLSLEPLADWFARVAPRAFVDVHARCLAVFRLGANLADAYPEVRVRVRLREVHMLVTHYYTILLPNYSTLR